MALPATVPATLPDLELALGQVVIDALQANGLVVSGSPILFSAGAVHDCCPKEGEQARVVVWWAPIDAGGECGGPMPVTIFIRQLSCWPVPANPIHPDDEPFTEHAAILARVAWVGTAALRGLVCDRAAARSLGMSRVEILPTTPVKPLGGCAGTQFTLRVWPMASGWYVPAL